MYWHEPSRLGSRLSPRLGWRLSSRLKVLAKGELYIMSWRNLLHREFGIRVGIKNVGKKRGVHYVLIS